MAPEENNEQLPETPAEPSFQSKRFSPIEIGFLSVLAFLAFLASSLLTESACYLSK